MGPAFFVMAILGCGDGQFACQEVRIAPAHYASIADCNAATQAVLARNTDLDYPEVAAQCRRDGVFIADAGSTQRHR